MTSELKSKFDAVKREAEQLSARIDRAQEFIGSLAGKIEAETCRQYVDPHSPKGGEFRLAVWRVGKAWILHYALADDAEQPAEYKKLHDASIKLKVFALGMIPDLVDAMLTEQSELLDQIKSANDAFDQFIKSSGGRQPDAG